MFPAWRCRGERRCESEGSAIIARKIAGPVFALLVPDCGHALSAGPARYDPDRSERIDRLTALVERGPFDLYDTLRLGSRWRELHHLTLNMEHVAGTDRSEPAQLVDANSQERMRPEWSQI